MEKEYTQQAFISQIESLTGKEIIMTGDFHFYLVKSGEITNENPIFKPAYDRLHIIFNNMLSQEEAHIFKNKEKEEQIVQEILESNQLKTSLKESISRCLYQKFDKKAFSIGLQEIKDNEIPWHTKNYTSTYLIKSIKYRCLAINGTSKRFTIFYTDRTQLLSHITNGSDIEIVQPTT